MQTKGPAQFDCNAINISRPSSLYMLSARLNKHSYGHKMASGHNANIFKTLRSAAGH